MKNGWLLTAALAISAAALTGPGFAADLDVIAPPPPVVVEPVPVMVPVVPVVVPVVPHIWLGHFTGGARTAIPGVMDWRDEFQRFASRRECLHWLHALKRAYRAQEGFKTCLPIR